jgi:hypothetical protein
MMLTKDLGRFHVTSGAITAVDPAYVTVEDSNCAVTFKAKNGIWLATVEEIPENTWDGTRVTDVTVRHVDYPKATPDVLIEGEVGVDTASAGFFDADFFDDEEVFENMDQFCCGGDDSTFPKHGVICASGYGDGGYPCFVSLDGDDAVAARIVFITDANE